MDKMTRIARTCLLHLGLAFGSAGLAVPPHVWAQAPVPARATPQRGTVMAIEGSNLTLATDGGQQIAVSISPTVRVQRLAPGSTDLKTAEAATLSDVAMGDRVLVTGTAGETPLTFNAARVILMKSGDIAQKHEAEQQDWQRRGTSGIVNAVDASTATITMSSGARKLRVDTAQNTSFRRYADGSVKFEDAKPGTLAQIHAGDQMLVRGAKSEDGSSVHAEEVVSGSFKNLSGTVLSLDAAANTVSLKDLVTKRNVTVRLTANTAVHRLSPEAAARFSARAVASSTPSGGTSPAGPSAAPTSPKPASEPSGGGPAPQANRSASGDLSKMVATLPILTLSDLHVGDAVMIVAEQSSADASSLTAITLLAGVEPLLAAAPGGAPAMTLSPWSVGSGSPDGGGSQ